MPLLRPTYQKNSSTTIQAVSILAISCIFGVNLPSGYSNWASSSVSTPTGLFGALDTNGNMNLSWQPIPGVAGYVLDRETITNGIWLTSYQTLSTNSFSESSTNYGDGGYRYRVSSFGSGQTSAPSSVFPLQRYVVIDLGTNQTPIFLNNGGAVVMQNSAGYTYWKAGASQNIPLGLVGGLNDSDVVAGVTGTGYMPTNTDAYGSTHYLANINTWSASSGTVSGPLYDSLFSGLSSGSGYDSVVFTGIDNNGHVYGFYNKEWKAWNPSNPAAPSQISGEAYITGKDLTSIGVAAGGYSVFGLPTSGTSFVALNVSPSGVILGRSCPGGHFAYPANVWTFGYTNFAYYDGSNLHTLTNVFFNSVNSAGQILGTTNGAPCVFNASTNTVAPPPIVGPWNASHQVISGGLFYDPLSSPSIYVKLPGLITDNSGWSSISATAINDSGVITATATYTGTNFATGGHAIVLIPLQITRDNMAVTNNIVVAGQQINLMNTISGAPTNVITSSQWYIPGAVNGTAFKDYQPGASDSGYVPLTNSDFSSSSISFYWSDAATNRTIYCTNVIYGQTNVVSTSLNIERPIANVSTTTDQTTIDNISSGGPRLRFGNAATKVDGITFSRTTIAAPPFGGSYVWNQIISTNYDMRIDTNFAAHSLSTNGFTSYGYDAGRRANYPYANTSARSAVDSPSDTLYGFALEQTRSMTAKMYLMWKADSSAVNGDNTVVVPLKSWQWTWSATATNGLVNNTNGVAAWGVQTGTCTMGATNIDETNEPVWTKDEFNNRTSL